MGNVHMEAAQINYRGGEKKMSVEEALKNTSGEAAAIAQLQQDVSDLNDVKANKITIAPTFSAETAYDPGDLVYYNGLTYRCVNAHSGEWDADDFAATTIDNEISELRSGLMNFVKSVEITGATNTNGNFNISISGRNKSNTSIIEIVGVRESPYYSEYYTITPAATLGSDSWTVKLVGDSAPLSQQDIKLMVRYVELS